MLMHSSSEKTDISEVVLKLLHACLGEGNVVEAELLGQRLSVAVKDSAVINESDVLQAGFRGLVVISAGRVQVLTHDQVTD
jgi:phosphotransferase system IIB component